MKVTVKNPGILTTVQDQGRFGYYHLGIPQSGALDMESAAIANRLVGNDLAAAVVECTHTGPELYFPEPATIAVTGAPVIITIDGREQPGWTRLFVPADTTLTFGDLKGGMRFYIAIRGGIDVPEVLGSRSTYALGAFGGFEGRKLAQGDELPIGEPTGPEPEMMYLAERLRPTFGPSQEVRIIFGLYDHYLTLEGRRRLVESDWTLTAAADRMGMRFDGPGVEWESREPKFGAGSDPSNIVDAGYAVGSIQIPGGTKPIVLHRDAVSGGGYAMVATVISTDLDIMARCATGTILRFRETTMEEALAARRAEHAVIRTLRT